MHFPIQIFLPVHPRIAVPTHRRYTRYYFHTLQERKVPSHLPECVCWGFIFRSEPWLLSEQPLQLTLWLTQLSNGLWGNSGLFNVVDFNLWKSVKVSIASLDTFYQTPSWYAHIHPPAVVAVVGLSVTAILWFRKVQSSRLIMINLQQQSYCDFNLWTVNSE